MSNYNQIATYWAPGARDGYGQTAFASPVSLTVRWQDKQENFLDPQGEILISNAVVYPQAELAQEGYLFLGTSAIADPKTVSGAYKIRALSQTVNLKNKQTLYKIWL